MYFNLGNLLVGIVPSKYIAGVMNDGKFSAHMIKEETQIVIMDEWTPDSLSCEDAKRVLQGFFLSQLFYLWYICGVWAFGIFISMFFTRTISIL